ncbi:hypothetical protein HRbin06_00409 [archaeon HR06]|nr:hypothetical protein HRbin06_00409 [archaeon HR06]
METYNLKLEVISPTHIGSGSEIVSHLQYFYDNGKLYFIDEKKLIEELIKRGKIEDYSIKASQEDFKLKQYLDSSGIDVNSVLGYRISCYKDVKWNIMSFIKDPYLNAYIPATEIKGAIRSAIIYKKIKEIGANRILEQIGRIKPKDPGKIIERVIRKDNKTWNDLMRLIHIKDTEGINVSNSLEVIRIDLINTETRRRNNLCYLEALKQGVNFITDLKIYDEKISESLGLKISIDEVINSCKQFYEDILNYELNRIKALNILSLNRFYEESLKKLNKDEFLIRIGWGTGHYSKTIGMLIYNNPNFSRVRAYYKLGKRGLRFPASIKLAIKDGNELPLGWIKVKIS